jgi:hypothetical protein
MRKTQSKKAGKSRRRKRGDTPGPKPDILKIEEDWQDAIKKSLTKKKPADGWPK